MDETKKEPTTAELFATAKRGHETLAQNADSDDVRQEGLDGLAALSELERRMVAMARAIRMRLEATTVRETKDAHEAMRAALIDAPPVFTMEEVREVFKARLHHKPLADAMKELAALRSTGGGR